MKNLILYGSQSLSNKKLGVEEASGFRGTMSSIQKISNARFSGSTIVDKKIDDRLVSMIGVVRATDDQNLQEVINEYSKAFNKEDRYLRISPNYHAFTPLADETGWQTVGDTVNISFDSGNLQCGDGSIQFDADVSIASGYCGVYTLSGTETDLSEYGDDGSFEAWVYLPQIIGVTGIRLYVGNDGSNYYWSTVTQQYDGSDFEVGWNYVSCKISSMTIVGTIDSYSIGAFCQVLVYYSSLMADQTDFRVGGILWQEEGRTRNFRAFVEDFNVDMKHYDITRANCNIVALAYEGVAESTNTYNVLGLAAQTSATATGTVVLDGTHTPYPVVLVDIISATNVSGITLANTTTGGSVVISRTYSAGEKVIIDTDNRIVTSNGVLVDYDDVLPRFILGENDIQISISSTGVESEDETTQNSNLKGEA
jgi:hypothetical protein